MADKKCNPCTDNLFKSINSNPDLQDLIDLIVGEVGGGSNVEVVGENLAPLSLFIDREETEDSKTFTIAYRPYTPLTVNLSDNVNTLQLKGSTVNNVTLSWSFNKAVEFQQLSRAGVGNIDTPTITNATSYSKALTNQGITTNTTYSISADDDLDDGRGAKSDSTGISFGNYIYRTTITTNDRNNITAGTINGLTLDNLTKNIATTRGLTFTAQSDATSYDVILMPTAYGLTSGTQFKNLATLSLGGWGKLFSLPLTNSAGFEESYDVFVASNRFLSGLQFQIS